jgi:hypothetical protein
MTASTSTMQAMAIPGAHHLAMSDEDHLAQEMDARTREGFNVLTLLLEVVIGVWLLSLFLLALAWDPIDRRFGTRSKRIAARLAERPAASGAARNSDGAYAILPTE